jgi:AraC-like DNA-binding protein
MKLLELEAPHFTRIVLAILVHEGASIHKNRPSHGFALRVSGSCNYIFENGKTYASSANELIYLPKGSSYYVETLEAGATYAINFDLDSLDIFEPFIMRPRNPATMLESFRSAEAAWRKRRTGYYLECTSALASIFMQLQKDASRNYVSGKTTDTVRTALRYISEQYTDPELRIPQIASHCGLSEVYLRRLFDRVLGTSPSSYILELRLQRAKSLIGANLYSMQQVAALSGFSDYTYFSRAFKKKFGASPQEYRE